MSAERSNLLWTTLQVHLYSNGQADSFFMDGPVRRNNYRRGDFSTNYARVTLSFAHTNLQKNILSASLVYQRDFDPGGLLARSIELENYYGDDRLLFSFQWVQKPRLVTVNYRNRAQGADDVAVVAKRRQLAFRTELEGIMGDLTLFPGDNKHRIGWHNYLTFMLSLTNEVGFMAHTYMGRDYLNIRFDDVVFIGELGTYVKFNAR